MTELFILYYIVTTVVSFTIWMKCANELTIVDVIMLTLIGWVFWWFIILIALKGVVVWRKK